MGWIDKPHRCTLPLVNIHSSLAKVGAWFECDYCKAEWKIQARVPGGVESHYNLTWIRREGGYLYTISWQER